MYTFTFVMEMSIVEPKIKYLFLSLYHQIHVYIEKISWDLFLFQYMAIFAPPKGLNLCHNECEFYN